MQDSGGHLSLREVLRSRKHDMTCRTSVQIASATTRTVFTLSTTPGPLLGDCNGKDLICTHLHNLDRLGCGCSLVPNGAHADSLSFVLLSKLVTQGGCKRDVEGLIQHKEELTSTVSAIQPQPATLHSGRYPQHGPQPDEDPDMCCVIVLKHRLEDTEEADSRNCKCTCSPETQPKEANDQSFMNAEQARLEGLLKESTEKTSKQCERLRTLKTEQAQLQGLLSKSAEETSRLAAELKVANEANQARDRAFRHLESDKTQSDEQHVAAFTKEQELHRDLQSKYAELQRQLTCSQREKAHVDHQLQEAQHARRQLEHGALLRNQVGVIGELLQLVMTCYTCMPANRS